MDTATHHDNGPSAAYDDFLSEDVNIPVTDRIDVLIQEVAELKAMMEPLGPLLAALPELLQKVDPFLASAKKSPVLKMLGISVP